MKKKLSIIVPVYNAEKYLTDLLDSIIYQINDYMEIILIDDGSTDSSLSICREYERKYPNVIVKNIENSGSGIARNTGIKIAQGEYLFFPDADDLVCEGAINTILDSLTDNPDYIVYNYYQKYRDSDEIQLIKLKESELDGKKIRKNYTQCLIPSSEIYLQGAPWNKVFKKSIIEENKLEFPQLKRHQDDVFIINYINNVSKIKIISKPIYIYFQNKAYDEALKFPKNYFEIRKEVYKIFMNKLNDWDSSELSKYYVAFSFALCLKRIFMLTYSNKWALSRKERNEFLCKVLNDEIITDMITILDKSYNQVISIIPKLSFKKKILYKFYIRHLTKKHKNILKIMAFVLYNFLK